MWRPKLGKSLWVVRRLLVAAAARLLSAACPSMCGADRSMAAACRLRAAAYQSMWAAA